MTLNHVVYRRAKVNKLMRVAAVIVNYRTPQLVLQCLDALSADRIAVPKMRAIVADNASGDGSAEMLSKELMHPRFAEWVKFLPLSLNGGFGWGNNQAILHLQQSDDPPDAIYLLNPDARIKPGALASLIKEMQGRSDAGAIGSQLLKEDGTLTGSAFRFPSVTREFTRAVAIAKLERVLGIQPMLIPYGQREDVDWVTGASVLLRTDALRAAGLFDTGFFLYFEEVELMHRLLHRGWKSYHCPESQVVHLAGASTGVVDGKAHGGRAPPDYVFNSRYRYFVLTGGRTQAQLADLAWLFGEKLARLIRVAFSNRAFTDSFAEKEKLLRIGRLSRIRGVSPANARITDTPGALPEWMAQS